MKPSELCKSIGLLSSEMHIRSDEHTREETPTEKHTMFPFVTNTHLFIDPLLFDIHSWHPLVT